MTGPRRSIRHCQLISNLLLLLLVGMAIPSQAQYTVRIEVSAAPALHKTDSIFIAGNFNNWNPGNTGYVLTPVGDRLVVTLRDLPAEVYEFKFTRGNWNKVQTTATGGQVSNNILKLKSDTTISLSIAGWSDDFAAPPKQHTATAGVHIIDSNFYIPQLNRYRRLWVYLPQGYYKSSQRYPVLYMHDGQNLFDDYTSGYGEWGIDECLDSLVAKTKRPCIIVGIDNGNRRMNEYNPFDMEKYGKGEGDAYIEFIATTLKSYIDKQYRTLPGKDNTLIAGSSMGGLISYYAMLRRPDVFGKAGIFSPAFWTAPAIRQMTDSLSPAINGKFFFYMGRLEGTSYVQDMEDVMEQLGANSSAMIYSVIDEEGKHNEQSWRKWFAEFYNFIMADGFNNVVRIN